MDGPGRPHFTRGRTCPPTSHTVKLMFLYSTVSTLNPARDNKGGRRGVVRRCSRVFSNADGRRARTDRGNRGHDLAQLELVQDGGLRKGGTRGREEEEGNGLKKNTKVLGNWPDMGKQRHVADTDAQCPPSARFTTRLPAPPPVAWWGTPDGWTREPHDGIRWPKALCAKRANHAPCRQRQGPPLIYASPSCQTCALRGGKRDSRRRGHRTGKKGGKCQREVGRLQRVTGEPHAKSGTPLLTPYTREVETHRESPFRW